VNLQAVNKMNAIIRVFLLVISISVLEARKKEDYVDVRLVGAFQTLHVEGSYVVNVELAEKNSVTIRSDNEKSIEFVVTTVEGGVLTIRPKNPHLDKPSNVEILVKATDLRNIETFGSTQVIVSGTIKAKVARLTANGSSRITVAVDVEKLFSTINGAGIITVSGEAEKARVDIDGAGIYLAGDLKTKETTINVVGSGDLTILAKRIEGTIDGAGTIQYRNNPEIHVKTIGHSKLVKVKL